MRHLARDPGHGPGIDGKPNRRRRPTTGAQPGGEAR